MSAAAVKALGPLSGPVLIFGGPYSNLQSLAAMRDVADRMGIAPQQVICTGDVVAYCAEPEATVALIREWGVAVVMGNCEESLARDADNCGCGFGSGSACDLLSAQWYSYARRELSDQSRDWMGTLPRGLSFELGGLRFRVVHGGVGSINRFLFQSSPRADFQQELALADADWVIGGHCGIPFGRPIDGGGWLNAGVIGMPANDGSPQGWYMVLEPSSDGVVASWHRLDYDVELTAARMNAAALAPAYAEALLTGLWPSLDILPEREAARAGRPLTLAPMRL